VKELISEIEIHASGEKVWQILTDFERYPEWNPFIRWAKGQAITGTRLTVRIQPSGAGGTTFTPTVLKVEPNRELRWLGRLVMPGIFDGEHIFSIETIGAQHVLFTQREIYTGFEEMNQALKALAEQANTK
jgi:hypothetical protein